MKALILITLFILPAMGMASEAKFFYVSGKVILERQSKNLEAKKGMEVLEGDVLKTNGTSFAIIKYAGNSTFKLDPNSALEIQELHFKLPESKKASTILKLKKGAMMIDFSNPDKDKEIEVKVGQVAMGVRGTKFVAAMDDNDEKDIYLIVHHGKVNLYNFNDDDYEEVTDGETSVVTGNKRIGKPLKMKWTNTLNWSMRTESPSGKASFFNKFVKQNRLREKKETQNVWSKRKKRSIKADQPKEYKRRGLKESRIRNKKLIRKFKKEINQSQIETEALKRDALEKIASNKRLMRKASPQKVVALKKQNQLIKNKYNQVAKKQKKKVSELSRKQNFISKDIGRPIAHQKQDGEVVYSPKQASAVEKELSSPPEKRKIQGSSSGLSAVGGSGSGMTHSKATNTPNVIDSSQGSSGVSGNQNTILKKQAVTQIVKQEPTATLTKTEAATKLNLVTKESMLSQPTLTKATSLKTATTIQKASSETLLNNTLSTSKTIEPIKTYQVTTYLKTNNIEPSKLETTTIKSALVGSETETNLKTGSTMESLKLNTETTKTVESGTLSETTKTVESGTLSETTKSLDSVLTGEKSLTSTSTESVQREFGSPTEESSFTDKAIKLAPVSGTVTTKTSDTVTKSGSTLTKAISPTATTATKTAVSTAVKKTGVAVKGLKGNSSVAKQNKGQTVSAVAKVTNSKGGKSKAKTIVSGTGVSAGDSGQATSGSKPRAGASRAKVVASRAPASSPTRSEATKTGMNKIQKIRAKRDSRISILKSSRGGDSSSGGDSDFIKKAIERNNKGSDAFDRFKNSGTESTARKRRFIRESKVSSASEARSEFVKRRPSSTSTGLPSVSEPIKVERPKTSIKIEGIGK